MLDGDWSERYDEGVEDAELELEMSGLSVDKLLADAQEALGEATEDDMALREYRRGRRDRLKEAEEEARFAAGTGWGAGGHDPARPGGKP